MFCTKFIGKRERENCLKLCAKAVRTFRKQGRSKLGKGLQTWVGTERLVGMVRLVGTEQVG